MIHGVSANHDSFHSVSFKPGLNVILATKKDTSSKKDTRNGVGKTTLLRIIDFCLGAELKEGVGLGVKALLDWSFTLELTLAGNHVQVTRSLKHHKQIEILGTTEGWPVPESEKNQAKLFYPNEQIMAIERWRWLLGQILFNLPDKFKYQKFNPSYRNLISYFLRIGNGAYLDPFRHFSRQPAWSTQLHNAYLLGLNWEYASEWQTLKVNTEKTKLLSKAIQESGGETQLPSKMGELQAKQIQTKIICDELKQQLDTFKVHKQYEAIQNEANQLTKEIQALNNQSLAAKRRLDLYRSSIQKEPSPAVEALNSIYQEAGLVFPDQVKRHLNEARTFHETIIHNRRAFLESEIKHLQNDLATYSQQLEQRSNRRAKLLETLKTYGALQDFVALRERYLEILERLHLIEQRQKDLRQLESDKKEHDRQKSDLALRSQQDYHERQPIYSEIIGSFFHNSSYLYDKPGNLIINTGATGYKYKVEIEREGSDGIEKMKIFCYDLALLQFQRQNMPNAIDFLIHDSMLYDGVDARQHALALQLAHQITTLHGGQYICTLNSHVIPSEEFDNTFKFKDYVRLKLSDSSPAERLLGMRF